MPPVPLDSAIIFAPAGDIVPFALEALAPGGTLALAGIHVTEIPPLDYQRHVFHEKVLTSVESNTRRDGEEFLTLAARLGELSLRDTVRFVHSFACFLSTRPNEQIYNQASEGGKVVTFEVDPRHAEVARANNAREGMSARVDLRVAGEVGVAVGVQVEPAARADLHQPLHVAFIHVCTLFHPEIGMFSHVNQFCIHLELFICVYI